MSARTLSYFLKSNLCEYEFTLPSLAINHKFQNDLNSPVSILFAEVTHDRMSQTADTLPGGGGHKCLSVCKMVSSVLFNLTCDKWHVKKALNTFRHFVGNFVSYTFSTQPVQQRIVAPSKYCFVPVDQVWIKGGDWRVNRACYCMTSFDQLVGSRGLEGRGWKARFRISKSFFKDFDWWKGE